MIDRFQEGLEARKAGKSLTDCPYIVGRTKLGSPRFSAEVAEWVRGYGSFARTASQKEIAAAASVDVRRFRRKPNRYYS